eukprot:scaffold22856_cov50-Cyclotella_meneghiniana.AAC.5
MLFDKRILKSTWIAGIVLGGGRHGVLVKALGGGENIMQMQGQPDAAYENGDLILGSSNVLRGGLNVLDIAVSDAEDGDDLEVEIANLQGDLRGSAHVKSSEDLEVAGCQRRMNGFCFGRIKQCCSGMTCDGMRCKQTASPTPSPTSPTPSPTANPPATPTESPTSICTITQEYSDGTGGNWELISSIGTDPSEVTTLKNLDEFVIPADQVVNVVGTLVVYAKTIIIEGTLDGSGGGYAGAPASYTEHLEYAPDGEQPACDLDEIGECKSDSTIDGNGKGGQDWIAHSGGGGGAGHGGAGGKGGQLIDMSPMFRAKGGSAYDTDFFDTLGGGGGAGCDEGYGEAADDEFGGSGGAGGGAVFLYAHNITINGGIKVNGVDGGIPTIINVGYCVGLGGGGGGSGGSLQISACNLSFDTVNSEVQANGGNGGYGGGGGGGGIVKINAANHNIDEIVISNSGGARGEGDSYPDIGFGFAGNAGPAALINGVSFAIEE